MGLIALLMGGYVNAFNPISIGNGCTVSANANIVSTGIDYRHWFHTGEKRHTNNVEIVIGDNVWIGCNAIILPGVHITGEYVVIAAGAVVTRDIYESRCIVAGCPARVIKSEGCEIRKDGENGNEGMRLVFLGGRKEK